MKYSSRLGEITDLQLQKALDTFDLGKLQTSSAIKTGLFGQNLFLSSTKGKYVLRGKPHYDWQFPTEKFFVEHLHAATQSPVPYPYHHSQDKSIFGWEFILMPQMPGDTFTNQLREPILTEQDRLDIAAMQGKMLSTLQKLRFQSAGKFDLETSDIKPFSIPLIDHMAENIMNRMQLAQNYNKMTTAADIQFTAQIIASASEFMTAFEPVCVMQDYKSENMTYTKINDKWQVTGIFDFMESYSGHPEADLARTYCIYKQIGATHLAETFISSYFEGEIPTDFYQRLPFFILHDRSIIWEWNQREEKIKQPFQEWMKQFLNELI